MAGEVTANTLLQLRPDPFAAIEPTRLVDQRHSVFGELATQSFQVLGDSTAIIINSPSPPTDLARATCIGTTRRAVPTKSCQGQRLFSTPPTEGALNRHALCANAPIGDGWHLQATMKVINLFIFSRYSRTKLHVGSRPTLA